MVAGALYLSCPKAPHGFDDRRVKETYSIHLQDLPGFATNEMADWWRFFRLALTESPPGLNLRNRYVHGLALGAMKQDTVVVLRICVLLRFLGRKAV